MTLPDSPYRGLSAFGESEVDALFFFGRERETELIAANLVASRLTVLYGASGVGKTSILRAGVARELRALPEKPVVVVFDAWKVDANEALASAVALEAGIDPLATVVETVEVAARVADVYVVLDQIEELFLYEDRDDARSVTHQLPELIARPGLRAHFALGVREDALAQLDVLKTQIPGLLANRLRLDHLDLRAARQAIGGPITRWNELGGAPMELEDALVERVLDEVAAGRLAVGGGGRGALLATGNGRVETPYLQLVMERLWEVEQSEGSGTLRAATLARLGGAARIVRDHLEDALETLNEPQKEAAARMFDHLVTPSGTKISHGVRDLAQFADGTSQELQPILDRLSELRILRSGGVDGDGVDRRYEIFHDVLADAVLEWRTRWYAQRVAESARRDAERRRRHALVVAGIALAALAVMSVVTIFAIGQRHEAISQRRQARDLAVKAKGEARLAEARALIATALSQLDTSPQQSLENALGAARIEQIDEVGDVLRQALVRAPLRLILPSHGGAHANAVFSPDGRLVLTSGEDGKARLFDARSGRLIHRLPQHSVVTAVTFGRGGSLVGTAGADGTARIWQTASGRLLRTLHHGSPVSSLSFSHSGNRVVTAGGSDVRVWQTLTGRRIRDVQVGSGAHSASLSPDGRAVVVVGRDRFARVYAVPDGRLLFQVPHGAAVTSAVFSPTGNVLATTSRDRTSGLWDAVTGEPLHTLRGHRASVLHAAFSKRGKLLVTTSEDNEARVWNVARGFRVATLLGHTNAVVDAGFSPDAKHIVTASNDHDARVWETAGGHARTVLRGHSGPVLTASFNRSGSRVVTSSADGTTRVWDPGTGDTLQLVGRQRGPILDAAANASGTLVATAGADGTARIWRFGQHAPLATLHHPAAVEAASFSPDGSLVMTACADGSARIWRVATGKPLVRLRHGRGPLKLASFSPDGRLVVTIGTDRFAKIWTVSGGKPVATLRHGGRVRAASFSPDGTLVLTASDDHSARIWRARDGRPLQVLHHRGRVLSATFSPDGRRVVTASSDRNARIWSVARGLPLHTLPGNGGTVTTAAFSPSGKVVVTASPEQDARLWNVATGKAIRLLRVHVAALTDKSFSPDGRWIVTAGPVSAGVWETATATSLLFLRGHEGPVTAAFFVGNERIVTASKDGTVRTYRCLLCGSTRQLVAIAKAREARIAAAAMGG